MSSKVSAAPRWGGPLLAGVVLRTLLLCGSPFLCCPLAAENGDIVSVSTALEGIEITDIALDTSDGSFWVLGADGLSSETHSIYHLSQDLGSLLATLENPHPPGSIEQADLTTHRGLAYRPLSRTLFALASVGPRGSQAYVLRELQRDGTVEATDVTVVPPGPSATLFGLAYDSLSQTFWTLDARGDELMRFGLDGVVVESFQLPGKSTPETVIHGRGVSFDIEAVDLQPVGRLYAPYGDIFRAGPAKLTQLKPVGVDQGGRRVGEATGVEVPLSEIPESELRGFQTFRIGVQRRIAVTARSGRIYHLEQVISDPVPPTELRCALTVSNQVSLSWTNHGAGSNGAYNGGLQVLRNGVPFVMIDGDLETYLDTTPVDGTSTYALRGFDADGDPSAASCPCDVTVGPGGLVRWNESPGESLGDLTRDTQSGELYVADPLGGAILRFDPELGHLGEIPSPWSDPMGVAFVPSIQIGFPPAVVTDLLAVTRSTGNQVRLIDLEGVVKTTTNLAFQGFADPSAARIGALVFVPGSQRFIVMELTTGRLYTFSSSGGQIDECKPPDILLDVPMDRALTYDPIQDTLLVGFQDGLVREIFIGGDCPLSGFEFELRSLGQGWDQPGFAGGIQIVGNTLVVTGKTSNALYQSLIFPFSPVFIRGDFNRDAAVNVSDALAIASYLFQDGLAPVCLDSADVNDDGVLDVGDPVYLLFSLFVAASPPPPAPYPGAGDDPTFRDNLGCAE